jgi:catechol 2,3-dioxygenase-like lactoylglutathione lyase family enzyme
MVSEYPIHTALPATDLERAKRFYADKLGLTPVGNKSGAPRLGFAVLLRREALGDA